MRGSRSDRKERRPVLTAGVQCDNCRKFAPMQPPGWLYVVQPSAEPSFLASLGVGSSRDEPGTLCSLRCLAEWAYVQVVTSEPATGQEMPVQAGTGWPW